MSAAAFLCYAPEDAAAGALVRGWLEGEKLSVTTTQPAADGAGALSQQTLQILGEARAVVVLLSSHTQDCEAVRREVLYALGNARPIVPVQLGELKPDGWLRLLTEGQGRIDARPALGEGLRPRLIEAVRAANANGRVIAMLNIKGGVGKTVLAANLFTAAHLLTQRSIVFVDLDPQHNLTQYFLASAERNRMREINRTLYSVFVARAEAGAAKESFDELPVALNRNRGARKTHLDLVLGDERLFEFTLDIAPAREKEEAFARFHALIAALRSRYQAVVIDTNPCATFLTRCAVTAADHIVAPVRPEKYSLAGLNLLESVTRIIRQRPARSSEFSILLNGVGERARLAGGDIDAFTREEIAAAPFFGAALLPIAVPFSALLRASPADRFASNPINTTAITRFSQRALKETLTAAAAAIFARAEGAAASGGPPATIPVHAPDLAQSA